MWTNTYVGKHDTLPKGFTEANHLQHAFQGTSQNLVHHFTFCRNASTYVADYEVAGEKYWGKLEEIGPLNSRLPKGLTNVRLEYIPGMWGPTLTEDEYTQGVTDEFDGYELKVYGDLVNEG